MRSYGQYCPMARASELLAERWTLILVRNLLAGCRTFGDLRAGAPGIPKALLSARLESLTHAEIVVRRPRTSGRGWEYELTEKGRALRSVCEALGAWGAAWLEIEPHHVDPAYVVWATARLVDLEKVPQPGVTIRLDLSQGAGVRRFWMLLFAPRVEVCTTSLGRHEDLVVSTDPQTLADCNLRRTRLAAAMRTGRLQVSGPPALIRSLPSWIAASPYAHVEPRVGQAHR
jgi:DNA-binding HxlR family transcriptional regulator